MTVQSPKVVNDGGWCIEWICRFLTSHVLVNAVQAITKDQSWEPVAEVIKNHLMMVGKSIKVVKVEDFLKRLQLSGPIAAINLWA